MTEKEKKTYVFLLSLRLAKMLDENIKEKEKWNKLVRNFYKRERHTQDEYDCFYRAGVKYPKSAINRVRIELNQVLLEIEKEHVL